MSDPANQNPFSRRVGESRVASLLHVIPQRSYIFQRSINLMDWITLSTATADPTGKIEAIDEDPPPAKAFYRLSFP